MRFPRSRPRPPAAPGARPRRRRRSGWAERPALPRIGQRAAGIEGQRLEVHARRVQVLVAAALGMHAVEAADDVVVHHVDDRLGDAVLDRLEGMHAFLDDDLVHLQAFLDHRHLVALAAVQADHLGSVLDRHHAHAVGAGIGLDDDERLVADAVFLVLGADAGQQRIDLGRQAFLAGALLEVDLAADAELGVDAPRVDADRGGELARHAVVAFGVLGLAARMPACVQRRDQPLLVQALEHRRNPRRQVVVEQHRAGAETVQADAAAAAPQRLQRQRGAVGQLDHARLGDLGQQAADAHFQSGQAQDGHQLGHILQVELVAGVVLGDQQQLAGVGADALDRDLGGLHAQWHEGVVEVVEAAREQVQVDRRELEARVAQVGRAVEGRHVVLPLGAEPLFDVAGVVEELALQFEQRPGECGGEVRNHGLSTRKKPLPDGRRQNDWRGCYTMARSAHAAGACGSASQTRRAACR